MYEELIFRIHKELSKYCNTFFKWEKEMNTGAKKVYGWEISHEKILNIISQ